MAECAVHQVAEILGKATDLVQVLTIEHCASNHVILKDQKK
jgi:hypothetical protein